MATAMYAVEGTMGESCRAAVLENVHSLSGVTIAAMDFVTGGQSPLIVTSNTKLGAEVVRHAVEHQGRTYYFCGKGCARAFTADPGRYLNLAVG